MQYNIPEQIYNLAKKLWPINRSITGDGVRETLSLIKEEVKDLKIFEIPSGTEVLIGLCHRNGKSETHT